MMLRMIAAESGCRDRNYSLDIQFWIFFFFNVKIRDNRAPSIYNLQFS